MRAAHLAFDEDDVPTQRAPERRHALLGRRPAPPPPHAPPVEEDRSGVRRRTREDQVTLTALGIPRQRATMASVPDARRHAAPISETLVSATPPDGFRSTFTLERPTRPVVFDMNPSPPKVIVRDPMPAFVHSAHSAHAAALAPLAQDVVPPAETARRREPAAVVAAPSPLRVPVFVALLMMVFAALLGPPLGHALRVAASSLSAR